MPHRRRGTTGPGPTDPRSHLRRRLFHVDLAAGLLGLGLIALSLVGVSGASAADPTPVTDGSDWGAQGSLVSDSGQTASWDNTGNAATSTVPRNATQVIPHTDGKTYANLPALDQSTFQSYFGASNGLGGLKVSVSQTQDLVNQGVNISISGAKPDIPNGQTDSTSYFQIFQCWGAMGSNGQPDPSVTSPDPQTCQVGSPGTDSAAGSLKREYRTVTGDPLVGGDWAQYNKSGFLTTEVPFLAIDGEQSGANIPKKNTFFNTTTTNELSHVTVSASGNATRQFEMQTGAESSGLGCGYRADQPSTASCWLVVVPRISATSSGPGIENSVGPISPSVWAQRMQFKLGFQNVPTSCPAGRGQSLVGGSELMAVAAGSWIPGVCAATGVTLGYNKLSDQVARQQYSAPIGGSNAVLTSDPVTGTNPSVVVPLALSAPVIAFNFSYHPVCSDPDVDLTTVTTDTGAAACGYANLVALKADIAKTGQPVRDLKLNALLVAKLLTMSYSLSLIQSPTVPEPAWAQAMPSTLTADPDFIELNPQLHLLLGAGDLSSLVVEAQRTDAGTHIWQWLNSDPAASAFLSGCPDDQGQVINPFYSTGTYVGCQGQAAALEAQAVANRAATTTPPGFTPVVQSYPPTGLSYPQPQWQQQPALVTNGTVTQSPLTLTDWQPRVQDMSVAGRDTFTGFQPRNSLWCDSSLDSTCLPAPGKWKSDPSDNQPPQLRHILSITDSATAARFQLATAQLCDDAGTDCVGADTDSLDAAAADFQPSSTPGFVQPATKNDYAGGAYPLTLPVYAVVRNTLPDATRLAYAQALGYVLTRGQVPGYQAGDLPPGYSPLPTSLQAQAVTATAALKIPLPASAVTAKVQKKKKHTSSAKPSAKPSSSASATASASPTAAATPGASTGPGSGDPGGLGAVPSGGTPSGAASSVPPAASASPSDTTVATTAVAASTESFHGWILPLGVGLALGAGMAGPFLRRRTNMRLR